MCEDVYLHQVTRERRGWSKKVLPSIPVPSPARSVSTEQGLKTAEDTRKSLETWLPREEWFGINPLLVRDRDPCA